MAKNDVAAGRPHLTMKCALVVLLPLISGGCEQSHFRHGPSAVVVGLSVSCFRTASTPANTTSCNATAEWSDGGPQEAVRPFAAWTSSNAAIATTPPCSDQGFPSIADRVNGGIECGRLTHVSNGFITVTATFGGRTASTGVSIVFQPQPH